MQGEALQTVDMNQDGTLAEAYKMRNLLGEFETDKGQRRATWIKREVGKDGKRESAKHFCERLDKQAAKTPPVALVGSHYFMLECRTIAQAMCTF